MENPIIKSTHKKTKEAASAFYKKIGMVWCLVLEDYVAFNSIGFHHLSQKERIPRLKSEQGRRFALLIYAKEILENPNAIFSAQRMGNADFWRFRAKKDGLLVKLVVRQLDGGRKHFFSIFAKKQKSPPESVDL